MDLPPRRGAGPESTGIENAQLDAAKSWPYEQLALWSLEAVWLGRRDDPRVGRNADRSAPPANHLVARGHRLQGACPQPVRLWRPRDDGPERSPRRMPR